MNFYFTSDTHFGAQRTLELSRRPFESTLEMDDTMLNNFNNIVKKDDIIFHLGDFGNYKLVKEINCKVILIYGNYEEQDIKEKFNYDVDAFGSYLKKLGFYDVKPYIGTPFSYKLNDKLIYMAHEPSKIPTKFNSPTDVHLFGHIHERQFIKRRGLNVGVDVNNFELVDIDRINFYDTALKQYYDNEVFIQ